MKLPDSIAPVPLACSWVISWALLAAPATAQGPTGQDPNRPLPLWGDGEAVELRDQAVELSKRAGASINRLARVNDERQLRKIKPQEVNKVYATVMQLKRCAMRLLLWGEPAGADLVRQERRLEDQVDKLYDDLKRIHKETLESAFPKLVTLAQRRRKLLDQTEHLIEVNQLDDAERQFLPTYDELNAFAHWYSGKQRGQAIGPFDELNAKLAQLLESQLRQQAASEIAARIAERTPDYKALAGTIQGAAGNIQRNGVATLDGQSLTGPALLREFGKRWRATHLSTVHCLALTYANGNRKVRDMLVRRGVAGRTEVIQALVALVEADTAHAAPEQAPQIYLDYLSALAPLAVLGDDAVVGELDPALQKLAARQPKFAVDVANYRAVAAETLRWRARSAESRARAARQEFPQLQHRATRTQVLTGPAAENVSAASKELQGSNLSATNLLAPIVGARLTSPFLVDGVYVRTEVPPGFASAVEQLQSDLMVDSTNPPLTLEAATALESARRGNAIEIGGAVDGVELQSLIELMYSSSNEQGGPIRFGEVPTEPGNVSVTWDCNQVRLRVDLIPRWIRGKYLFADLR